MRKYRHTDQKIRRQKREIEKLKQSLDITLDLHELLQKNNNKLEKEKVSYRRIIKYSTMLMLLMNLLTSASGNTDIDRIVKRNILEYYRAMNKNLMEIPTNDENEFDDDEERFDESEGSDIWDGKEEFG